ncbi:hypothetical protein DFR29_104175 [Tahibacter aquaticus]|uniref:Uncharacterized protein n=1 Tax=Tahibacter aquaticus TaxID=520092 RepID=A0A4R6Z2D4_9GAMM|nr:hypothetical protein [Tahibacter aquaticus]TDR45747.1 hypothetical protein DFR29_104175 [Tahibacter aquaticus]
MTPSTVPRLVLAVLAFALCACSSGNSTGGAAPASPAATAAAPAATSAKPAEQGRPQLRMTIGGQPWQADREFFAAFHPTGYDRAVLMAASLGPKDKNEQAFNLNLFGVAGPGNYVASGNTLSLKGISSSAIQLANLDPSRYLIGGPFGYTVDIQLLQADAHTVEAKFHGSMGASDGSTLQISDGYFFYRQ